MLYFFLRLFFNLWSVFKWLVGFIWYVFLFLNDGVEFVVFLKGLKKFDVYLIL